MIQEIQGQLYINITAYSTAIYSILYSFREQNINITVKNLETVILATEPFISIQLGIFILFSKAGRQLANTFILN